LIIRPITIKIPITIPINASAMHTILHRIIKTNFY